MDSEIHGNTGRGLWMDDATTSLLRTTIHDQPECIVVNSGTLTISDSRIERCTSASDGGGIGTGLLQSATLDIRRTVFASNTSGREGGAIAGPYFANGPGPALRLSDVTFIDNQALRGGAVSVRGDAFTAAEAAWMTNCTFVGNSADTDGGAIHMIARAGAVRLENCTISGNSSPRGAGIFTDTGSVASVHDSIVAGNLGPGSDCEGAIDSRGYNLFGDMSGATLTGATALDLIGVDPLLGPVQDNGGPVPTSAPLLTSRAIEGGDPARCVDAQGLPLVADARGFVRPVDFDDDGFARCDVGAVEVSCGPDGDGDGLGDDCDCLPFDPGVRTAPEEVTLLVARSALGEALLSWTDRSADAGSATTYDVASATLSALVITRAADGPCVVGGLGSAAWSDARVVTDDGFYYLVRAANACGPTIGDGWGSDSAGIPRPACP